MRKLTARVVVGLMVVALVTLMLGTVAFAETRTTTYRVQPGDSLWKVANKFNTTVNYLKQLNNYWSNNIEVGQVLRVPMKSDSTNWTYTVQSGDTLWNISQRTGVDYLTIKQANNLSTNEIVPGQTLIIPGGNTESSSGTVSGGISYTQQELDMMARIIYAESRGEPYLGQVAVGAVLVNRVQSPSFPNTLSEVIHQELAFESVANGQYGLKPDATSYRAAIAAFSGQDPTNGALYFWNPAKVTNPKNWVWTRKIVYRVGNHVFAI